MITKYEYLKLKERYKNGYRWIARDSCESIYVYKLKPVKQGFSWKTSTDDWPTTCGDDFLFPYIKWEDEEPTKINDLISDYESHKKNVGGNNMNKAELIKEIEDLFDNIGIHDYRIGERCEIVSWRIDSKTIRKIFSAIEKYSIEKEKLYTVTLSNGSFLIKDPEFNTFQLCIAPKEQIEGYEYQLTQFEIESVDPILMQIAKEVE